MTEVIAALQPRTARRLPRFRRTPTRALALRTIHETILRTVGRFGLLNSQQLVRLVPTIHGDRLRKHAAALYHHGYLERPAGQQAALYDGPGSKPLVYALTDQGAELLKEQFGTVPHRVSPDVGHGYLAHELEVRDVLIAAAVVCRTVPALELLLWPELLEALPRFDDDERPEEWRVSVSFDDAEHTLTVRPDAIFAFKNRAAAPEHSMRHAFLENDRGTMPIMRRDLYGSSIMRKWLTYGASLAEDIPRERYGARSARVLIVTASKTRVRSMVKAFGRLAEQYDLPARLFLFADRKTLLSAPDFLAARWLDGAGVERTIFG